MDKGFVHMQSSFSRRIQVNSQNNGSGNPLRTDTNVVEADAPFRGGSPGRVKKEDWAKCPRVPNNLKESSTSKTAW